ncbi:MAG: di-trans,poly-cis-decaprenylcistransferase [bacterium]
MTPNDFVPATGAGLHVAMIMDGNGRWANAHGWSRPAGHRAGAENVRHIVEASPQLGIDTLTLYAFSSDNWQRPEREVDAIMRLFDFYLHAEVERCVRNGVRVSIIGRRDRLSPTILRAVGGIEDATRDGKVLHLRLAIDYSSRDAILQAAQKLARLPAASREHFAHLLAQVYHEEFPARDVDLLIRTGGEQRLSDFLLWECAYAELYFTPRPWPDFHVSDLTEAVQHFQQRERRFGRVAEVVVQKPAVKAA